MIDFLIFIFTHLYFVLQNLVCRQEPPVGPSTSRPNASQTPPHNLHSYDEERLFKLIGDAPVMILRFPAEAAPELRALCRKMGNSHVPCRENTYQVVKANLIFGWVKLIKIAPFYHTPGVMAVYDIFARSQRVLSLRTLRRMSVDRDTPPPLYSEDIMAAIRDIVS